MTAYIPQVYCGNCGKQLQYGREVRRCLLGKEKRRVIEVICHGERQELPFATEPKQSMVLWPSTPSTPPSKLN
jgi:hypothetical protein